jgi:general secretion pathway protein I
MGREVEGEMPRAVQVFPARPTFLSKLFARHGARDGFTLIEVLVALTILSLTLAIIFSVFSKAMRGRRVAEEYEQATLLAESKLSSIGVTEPIQQGRTIGRFNPLYWWSTQVTPYQEAGKSQDWPGRPMTVTVTVSWGQGQDSKSVSLTTLRLLSR